MVRTEGWAVVRTEGGWGVVRTEGWAVVRTED